MDWIEFSVEVDGEAAEAVSELFNRLNSRPDGQGGAVTEVSGFDPVGEDHHPQITVRTYLPAGEESSAELQRQIEEGLWFLGRIYPLGQVSVRRLADEDWANTWKASYRPLRIGRRFLVIPAWLTAEATRNPDDLAIVLDPGMAFGTGLHPSTRLCLVAMEYAVRSGQRVLDAGCGSGILSIAAARLGAARVDAFDVDPIAVRATRENAALNELSDRINAFQSGGPGAGPFWTPESGPRPRWDVILVNILPHVILELLATGLHTFLAPGGCMILAGIIEAREAEIREAVASFGLRITRRLSEEDWVALVTVAATTESES